MKKNIFVVAAVCALTLLLTGCKTKPDTRVLDSLTSLSQITPAEIGVSQLSTADSVSVNGTSVVVKISADFPESGNFFAVNNIREWMSEQMGGTFAGNVENGQKMMEHYRDMFMADFKENVLPDLPPIEDMAVYKNLKFQKTYETDKIVTYLYSQEGYGGGAHGWFLSEGQTFRKSDGRRVDFDLFREESKMELASLIKDNLLAQYFEADKGNSGDFFFQEAVDFFPLPESAPVFTEKGVVFTYQQYEVAPYAAGLPTCTISYDLIEPFLTQAGRQLLNIEHVAEN